MAKPEEQTCSSIHPERSPPEAGVIPYIHSPDGDKHVQWLKSVFGAELKNIYKDKDEKKILHCQLEINGGPVYLSDATCLPQPSDKEATAACAGQDKKPCTAAGIPDECGLVSHLNVKDPHAIWKRALENDATVVVELALQFWGDVYGRFNDPFGIQWALCCDASTSEEELQAQDPQQA